MMFTKEQIEDANSRPIADYFISRGYKCERAGRETHIRGFGGFFVKDSTQEYFIHSKQEGGKGLVSCLMKVFDMDFKQAVAEALDGAVMVRSYQPQIRTPPAAEQKEQKIFTMPGHGTDNNRVRTYLSSRGISYELSDEFIRKGILFQDSRNNAVFLHYKDGVPCGAELHGTAGRFKGVAPGTSGSHTEYVRGSPEKVYVFESSIDMMSFLELHRNINNAAFAAMAGLKPTIVNDLIEKYSRVILCVDNDEAGDKFCKGFVGRCERNTECKLYKVKDHNELLQKIRQENYRSKIGRMGTWADKTIQKAERLNKQEVSLYAGR